MKRNYSGHSTLYSWYSINIIKANLGHNVERKIVYQYNSETTEAFTGFTAHFFRMTRNLSQCLIIFQCAVMWNLFISPNCLSGLLHSNYEILIQFLQEENMKTISKMCKDYVRGNMAKIHSQKPVEGCVSNILKAIRILCHFSGSRDKYFIG